MSAETTFSPRQLKDLALIVANTLADRGLVGPIAPVAVSYEVAGAMLGVSGRSIRNWCDDGLLIRCNLGQEEATPRVLVSSITHYLAAKSEKEPVSI